jgi:hypothetical protein
LTPIRAPATNSLALPYRIAQRKTNGRFICEQMGSVKAAALLRRKAAITKQ